jgi:hypothetical protein
MRSLGQAGFAELAGRGVHVVRREVRRTAVEVLRVGALRDQGGVPGGQDRRDVRRVGAGEPEDAAVQEREDVTVGDPQRADRSDHLRGVARVDRHQPGEAASTSSSTTMSALLTPDCGSAPTTLSIFTATGTRLMRRDLVRSAPVSGHVGFGVGEDGVWITVAPD